MKHSWLGKVVFLLVVTTLVILACKPAISVPTVPIRISIYGSTTNPVNISWTIHGNTGTVGNLILNHDNSSPYSIQHLIVDTDVGPVNYTIADSGSTGNNMVLNDLGPGSTIVSGFEIKTVDLNIDLDSPPGSGNFIVGIGDFLRDASNQHLYILEDLDPAFPTQVKVSDALDVFDDGYWELYTSNRSTITVIVERNGLSLHTKTAMTNTENVNLSYGSLSW